MTGVSLQLTAAGCGVGQWGGWMMESANLEVAWLVRGDFGERSIDPAMSTDCGLWEAARVTGALQSYEK